MINDKSFANMEDSNIFIALFSSVASVYPIDQNLRIKSINYLTKMNIMLQSYQLKGQERVKGERRERQVNPQEVKYHFKVN